MGFFRDAETAAHKYDAAARLKGIRAVNFPREGTNEELAPPEAPAVKEQTSSDSSSSDDGSDSNSGGGAAAAAAVLLPRRGDALKADGPPAAKPKASANAPTRGTAAVPSSQPLQRRSSARPQQQRYRGVYRASWSDREWVAYVHVGSGALRRKLHCGSFSSPEAAARAHDNVARKHNIVTLNFPRPGTDEVQAVFRKVAQTRSPPAAAEPSPAVAAKTVTTRGGAPRKEPPTSAKQLQAQQPWYRGVYQSKGKWSAQLDMRNGSFKLQVSCGAFASREEAARAYDDAACARGVLSVNFPRPGTDEVKAVKHAAFVMRAEKPAGGGSRPAPVAAAEAAGQDDSSSRDDDDSSEDEEDEPPPPPPPLPPRKRPCAVGDEATKVMPPAKAQRAAVGAGSADAAGAGALALAAQPAPGAMSSLGVSGGGALVAPPVVNGGADAAASIADVASFLRAIWPPLSDLDAIVAALPRSGVSMAHLRGVAASASALPDERMMMAYLAATASALGVTSDVERVLVAGALLRLAPRRTGGWLLGGT